MGLVKFLGDQLLFGSCLIVLAASLILTVKTRFIQFRKLPEMCRVLIFGSKGSKAGEATVGSHGALFTAMSTTIGISTIVSPVIAIKLGGPGAVVGFLVATLFGTAVNFTEVTLAVSFRKLKGGQVHGGPMQYLHDAIHPFVAKWYAFFGFFLLMAWSSAQANQLGEILNSPALGAWRVENWITGLVVAIFTVVILIGGIKRIADFSTKIVPVMFVFYIGASLFIICNNLGQIPSLVQLVIDSCLAPQTFATGVTVGGFTAAMRWGIFKGLQSNEAGVGTQTIPHSMAETNDPVQQGILSMVSTYSAGFICMLSCLVALITQTWLDPNLSLGINMVAASFQSYFSSVGIIVVAISAILFGSGTILGNSFNGSQCFSFLSKGRFIKTYFVATAALIFWGSISDVALVWSYVDYLLVPVLIPHIISIVYLAYRRDELLQAAA